MNSTELKIYKVISITKLHCKKRKKKNTQMKKENEKIHKS